MPKGDNNKLINGIKIILHRRTLVIGQSALNYFQEKLKNGTISQEEYDQLKKQLLGL
jgi:hypothetical protein